MDRQYSRLTVGLLAACLVGLLAARAEAQSMPLDRLVPAWSPSQQRAAEIASNVTLWTSLGLETWQSWQAEDRRRAFARQGARMGVVVGGMLVTKVLTHRRRPCAPDCGIDRQDQSFFSGHTALAFTATGARVAITMPLAASTGYFRIAANRHWLTDVLAGAGVGWMAARVVH